MRVFTVHAHYVKFQVKTKIRKFFSFRYLHLQCAQIADCIALIKRTQDSVAAQITGLQNQGGYD